MTIEKKKGVQLKIVEALQDDAYKGIARIDSEIMRELGIKRGDVISIKGSRETVAIADRAYPADVGEGIIRIDGILRRNVRAGIGDIVSVSKTEIKEAKKVMIAPGQKGIMVQGDPESLKRGLLGRAIVKGDILVLGGVQRRKDMFSDMGMDDELGGLFGNMLNDMGFGNLGGGGITQIRFVVVSTNPNQPCVITENTEVSLNPKAVEVTDEKIPEITYEDIGGLSEEIKKIREMVEIPLKHPEIFEKLGIEPPKGVLLHGPPGTGKTLLAKAVANESEANFILLNGPEIMSKFYGESEKKIRDIFEEAEKTAPAIIFIDEIDAIAPKREDVTGEVERRVVSQLLTMMDGLNARGKVVVIGATNRVNALDSALRRPGRFDREIIINVPDKSGRKTILNIHTRGMPLIPSLKKIYVLNKINHLEGAIKKLNEDLKNAKGDDGIKKDIERNIKYNNDVLSLLKPIADKLDDDEHKNELLLKNFSSKERDELHSLSLEGMIDEIASLTHGFVGADLSSLTKEAAMNVLRKFLPKMNLDVEESIPQEILEKLVVSHEDFVDALRVVRPSAMREVLVEAPNVTWESVGGLEKVKQELREAIEWPLKHPEAFERLGIKPSKGILLYGPPGTGKTLLAKAVAKQSEANFIQIKGPSLLSMWVGKSLPYNEELIVREEGIVKRMKIGDIVKNKLNVQVLAFDKDKRVGFTKISDYIKHKLDSKLMEVTTRTGRKIKVTDYHSLFSFVNGQFVSVPTNQLISNESYIAIPKNLNLPREEINGVNLYNYFKKDEDILVGNVKDYLNRAKKVIGLDKTSRILNVSKKYLADIIYKNLPVGIIEFDKLMNESKLSVDFKEIRIKFKSSKHDYPVIFKINKDFWRLIGLWVAEGDFNSDSVRIHNQNPEIRKDIRNICEEYNFKISEMETCVTINSCLLQKVFKNVFGLVGGSESKRLPTLSFVLDKESKANLLKGYFSGDGSIYAAERGKFKIEASTISKELANDLLYLFLDFGIVATCYTRDSKIYNNQVYRIGILGVKNFERFNEIGFIDKKRNDQILQYVRSRKWARSDLIPLSGELYELASSSASVYSTNQSIGKESLKNMLILVDKDKTKYKEYWDLVEGDLYLDLVTEIKEIDHEEYVYDISVPRDQNFVGGFGGVFAHNSEEGVRKIFERARQVAPCIIFFDEIDSLAGRRGHDSGTRVTERVLNQILAEMDGLEDLKDILIIGATNRPDMLDPAILRPGRFDKILLINAPDETGRKQILNIHTKGMPLAKDVDLDDLARKIEGYTGADVEGFVREAALLALRESMDTKQVRKKHFEEALKKTRPSVSKSTTDSYKKIEENFIRSAKAGLAEGSSYLG